MRLAVGQAPAAAGDIARNAATAADLVAEAAAEGAELVVLPELFLPGYDIAGLRADPARDVDAGALGADHRLEPLRTACRTARLTTLVGAAVRRAGSRRLSILCVDPDGEVTAPYDKQHLWRDEAGVFEPGDQTAVLSLAGWQVGLGVCYDGCFPEHARAVALQGAGLYACPAAYVVGSEHRRDLYYRARALDNGMYVAVAGLVGRCGNGQFSGGSAVLDPEGRALATAADRPRAVLVVDVDADQVARTRTAHTMLAEVAAPGADPKMAAGLTGEGEMARPASRLGLTQPGPASGEGAEGRGPTAVNDPGGAGLRDGPSLDFWR